MAGFASLRERVEKIEENYQLGRAGPGVVTEIDPPKIMTREFDRAEILHSLRKDWPNFFDGVDLKGATTLFDEDAQCFKVIYTEKQS